jgi:hypothetical protein
MTDAEKINLLQWGFVGDRATDNVARHTALMTYLGTLVARPDIYVPAGHFLFSAKIEFSLPGLRVYGAGGGASFLVGDGGVEFNYPQPTIENLAITPESATSANTGLILRNCWQATATNVRIHNFLKSMHVILDDEGEGLIPGNTVGGPYPNSQSVNSSDWPDLDEMLRAGLSNATTRHWGSRVTLCKFTNMHCKSKVTGGIGIHLDNTIADPTTTYDDFKLLTASQGVGVFYTGIIIDSGHFGCDDVDVLIGGGVHGVKFHRSYNDSDLHSVRLEYGAQTVELDTLNFDFGGQYAVAWEPSTAYVLGNKVRIADRQYTCVFGGTSDAALDYNGVPNSEFIGVPPAIAMLPLAGGNNADDLLTQAKPYAMDLSSVDVQIFAEGIEIIDGKRWLNMSAYLPVSTGSNETVNIWFGNPGRNLGMPSALGDEMFTKFLFQNRDPKTLHQPTVSARIRSADSSGVFTEQSAGDTISDLAGYAQGEIVEFTDTYTNLGATTATSSPYLAITFGGTQFGLYQFRVAQPQINIGASLGSYVRTYGRRRARNQDGPAGTGSNILDGTARWDYSGLPIAAVIAPRQAWEVNSSDMRPDLRITGYQGTNQPEHEQGGLAHYFCVTANPANSNGHPTTLED